MRIEKQTLWILLIFTVTILYGCGGNFDFSEKAQVKGFLDASNLFLEAGRYRKKIYEENQPERIRMGTITDEQLMTFINKLEAARSEASKVSDSVLSKIHPELPNAFNNLMIQSIDRQISSMNLGEIDQVLEDQVLGMTLHNEWIKWWNANHRQFVTK